MNVILRKHDYRKKRKGDGRTLVSAMKLKTESTDETLVRLVKEIAQNYPDKNFIIEHDGIIRFTITCNDQIIYMGDHYELENMLKEGTYTFSNYLIARIQEIS